MSASNDEVKSSSTNSAICAAADSVSTTTTDNSNLENASNEGLPPPATPPEQKRLLNEADDSLILTGEKKAKLEGDDNVLDDEMEGNEAEPMPPKPAKVASEEEEDEEVWIPIESDPDILTQLLRRLTFTEHYLLDVPVLHEGELAELLAGHTVKAFLFLYQINERTAAEVATSAGAPDPPANLFFMRQIIRNSCATVALVHAYMNCQLNSGLGSGDAHHVAASIIKEFAGQAAEVATSHRQLADRSQALGELFAANKAIKALHLEHAILGQSGVPVGNALAGVDNHYVALVGKGGVLYRLDGRCEKPLPMGEYVEDKGEEEEDPEEEVPEEAKSEGGQEKEAEVKEKKGMEEDEEERLSFLGASIQALSSLIARDPDNYNFNILAFCAPKVQK